MINRESNEALCKRIQAGDNKAMVQLVEQNMGMVVNAAKKMYSTRYSHDDLIREGVVGLIEATQDFEAEGHNDATFITHAMWKVRGRMSSLIAGHIHSRNQRKAFWKLPKARYIAMLFGEDEVTPEQLARVADVKTEDAEIVLRAESPHIAVDSLHSQYVDGKYNDGAQYTPVDETQPVDEMIAQEEGVALASEAVEAGLAVLNAREREIVVRHGLKNETLDSIAKSKGLSRERIRQLYYRSLDRMKAPASRVLRAP